MQTQLFSDSDIPILELAEAITCTQDALEIVSGSYEHNSNKVLLRAEQLPPEFFELQTRFAGEFIQKLVNYHLYVAGVFGENLVLSERFREYAGEARKGHHFRTFTDEDEAISWLCAIDNP
jgi:hypothetical protein